MSAVIDRIHRPVGMQLSKEVPISMPHSNLSSSREVSQEKYEIVLEKQFTINSKQLSSKRIAEHMEDHDLLKFTTIHEDNKEYDQSSVMQSNYMKNELGKKVNNEYLLRMASNSSFLPESWNQFNEI
jgi:hypothetical protein